MTVQLTDEMHQAFTKNGFGEEDIQNTVNHYRGQGQTDEQIFSNLDKKYKEFSGVNDMAQRQAKADKIQADGEAYRANLDKDLNAYKLKATAGAGLAIGGQALDLIPVVGATLGGAAYGAGMGMINNGSGQDIVKEAAINGAIAGVGAKVIPAIVKSPVGKFVGEKIGKPISKAVSPVFNKIGQAVDDKFGVNLGKELTKPRQFNNQPIKELGELATNPQKYVAKTSRPLAESPTVGEAPIQQTSPSSFALEADKTPIQYNQGTSQFAQTVKGSNLATEDLKTNINDVGYQAITNKDTLADAQKTIDKGQVEAINQVLTSDKPNANEIAMAHDLVRRLQQQGDVETAVKIVEDTSRKLTKAGQTIQAAKMWQQLTPDGALLSYQRAINQNVPEHVKPILDNAKNITKRIQEATSPQEIEQIVRKNFSGAAPTARGRIIKQIQRARETGTINEETLTKAIKDHYKIKTIGQADIDEINALTSQIAKATTDREKEVATALLQRKISEVKPVSLGRKLSTTQAMAQLLNPKTVIRNIGGNSMYGGIENTTQSLIAAPLDSLVSKFTGERTVLPNNVKTQFQGMKNGFNQGVQDVRLGVDTAQNKYDLPSGRTFRGGIGEKAEKLMNYTLRVPDRAAYQAVYEESLQNQIKARGLTEATDDIIAQAKEEALKRTFQDDSALSKLFQDVKKGLNLGKEFGLGDFVLKYAKTPANILSRGLSYSPVGLAKGVGELTIPSINKSTPFNQRKAVMDISRGLAGTTIMGGGYALAKSGAVTGQRDNNAKLSANLMAMGEKPYSVQIGDKNYTYDWAVPASMPFSAGVNYNNGADFAGSLASSMDTLTEQPLLQGVKKLSGGGYKTPAEGLVDVAADSLNSFYPSLLRQTAQTVDPYYRETRDNNVFKQALNRTISNTPFASQTLPEKYDVTGQPVMREGGIAQNFFNPANASSIKNDSVLNKSFELYQNEENSRALMPSASKSIKVNGEQLKLDNKQISGYQEDMGKIGYHLRQKAFENPEFIAMDDNEKVKYLDRLNQSVNQAVKIKLFGLKPKRLESYTQDILDNYNTFTKGQ